MKRRGGSEGQATVEMAIVLPLLLWLLVGMVDIARMANAILTVNHAAREAVRAGITGGTDAEIEARARGSMPALEPERVTVVISPAGARQTGADVSVVVTYRYRFLALFGVAGSEVPLNGQLTGRVE